MSVLSGIMHIRPTYQNTRCWQKATYMSGYGLEVWIQSLFYSHSQSGLPLVDAHCYHVIPLLTPEKWGVVDGEGIKGQLKSQTLAEGYYLWDQEWRISVCLCMQASSEALSLRVCGWIFFACRVVRGIICVCSTTLSLFSVEFWHPSPNHRLMFCHQ